LWRGWHVSISTQLTAIGTFLYIKTSSPTAVSLVAKCMGHRRRLTSISVMRLCAWPDCRDHDPRNLGVVYSVARTGLSSLESISQHRRHQTIIATRAPSLRCPLTVRISHWTPNDIDRRNCWLEYSPEVIFDDGKWKIAQIVDGTSGRNRKL